MHARPSIALPCPRNGACVAPTPDQTDVELQVLQQERDRASAEVRLRDEARELKAEASADSDDDQKLEAYAQYPQELRVQVNVTEDSNAAPFSRILALLAEGNDPTGSLCPTGGGENQAAEELETLGATKDEVLGNINWLAREQLKE